jgi:microcystin-dependent protein
LGTSTIPVSSWAGQNGANLLNSGLSINGTTGKIQANLRTVNPTTFSLDSNGQVSLFGATSSQQELPYITTTDGLVKTIQSSIYDVITATSLSGGAQDSIPIGSILPHARAFNTIPAGYLLCDGNAYDSTNTEYAELYGVIGDNWNTAGDMTDPGGDLFRVPNLSGGDVLLYGNNEAAPGSNVLYLSGANTPLGNKDFPGASTSGSLSAVGVNFIIKYKKDSIKSIFNGAPNQKTVGYGRSVYDQQIYEGIDSTGQNIQLSSAGFIAFALSGDVRNTTSDEVFDRFAIPVYGW